MSRGLLQAYGLSDGQREQIAGLAEACNAAEGLTMRLNWESLRRRPADQGNDFLYYDGERLVGFLGLYVFGRPEAEASAMVHPDYRRQRVFSEMLAAAQAEVRRRGIPSILFFCERGSPAAAPVMTATGANYEFTEYSMSAQPDVVNLAPLPPGLALRPGCAGDVPEAAAMDNDCFGMEGAEGYLERVLADPGQHMWAVTLKGKLIGKIHARVGETQSHIFGFCIDRPYRGQGYGRAALSDTVARLLLERRQPIELEVAAANDAALSLYRARGFEITIAYDYYRLPVEER